MDAKKILKYVYWFLMIVIGFMGLVNGIAYCIMSGQYFAAVGVAVLGWLAWPQWNEYRKNLIYGAKD